MDWFNIKLADERNGWLRAPLFRFASLLGYRVPGEPPLQNDQQVARLEAKLDRLSDDIQFLKRRLASYMDDGAAMTWLPDECPFFVNTGDTQGPLTLINGGEFEEDNVEVLLSYLVPNALCLDIGANLGFFTLKFAQRLRGTGHVMAFEPHPRLRSLMQRTLNLNGLLPRVEICAYGLSDQERSAIFNFNTDHLGSGRIAMTPIEGLETVRSQIKRLDDVLPRGTVVDVVKIDVEGHEQHVLRGMRRVISESPDIVMLIEKLVPEAGNEAEIENCVSEFGLALYGVEANATLRALTSAEFRAFGGYVLATRPHRVGTLKRSRFAIYPSQFWGIDHHAMMATNPTRLEAQKPLGELMFHGPYWFLRRGIWKVVYKGEIEGVLNLVVTEHFGRRVANLAFDRATKEGHIIADHDLIHFECAGYAGSSNTKVALECVEFERVG